MKVKVNWTAFTNISFKGSTIVEVDDDMKTLLTEDEFEEYMMNVALEESGFEFDFEEV